MPYCIVPKTGPGRIRGWERWAGSTLDPDEQRVPIDRTVDRDQEWWDGSAIVPIPQAEKDAEEDRQLDSVVDAAKVAAAFMAWHLVTHHGLTAAQARQALTDGRATIKQIYKAL